VFPDNLFAPLFLVCAMDGSHNKLGRLVGSGIFLLLGTSKVVIASYIIYETRLLSSKHLLSCKKWSHKKTGLILTTGTCRSALAIGSVLFGNIGRISFFHGPLLLLQSMPFIPPQADAAASIYPNTYIKLLGWNRRTMYYGWHPQL
jgi:hypothetical protein